VGPAINLRVSGIRVRAGLATPFAMAVVAGGATSTLDRARGTELAFASLAFIATVAALTVHEAVRIAVYRRQGVPVRGIDLSLAGGSLSLLDRNDTPRREAFAGFSGLIVLVALATCAWLFERTASSAATHDIARLIAIAVVSLSILHAMPALPFDGGRLLRGFVWFLTDNPVQGARTTAIYGHLIALALVAGGTLLLPSSGDLPYWGFGAIVAGLQLASACTSSLRDSRWQALGAAVTLVDAGLPLPGRVASNASVEDVVDALIGERDAATLLVIDESQVAIGVIRLANLRRVRRADWGDYHASQVMTSIDTLLHVSPESTLLDVLAQLDDAGQQLAVAQLDDGHTILVLRDQLLDLLVTRPNTAAEQSNPHSSSS
jgi:hypothetical protein